MSAVKPWYRSRTLWLNLLALAALVADATAQALGVLAPLFPPGVWPWVAAGITLVNLYLRVLTTARLQWRKEGE
jgi:hypothetical protein